MVATTDNWPIQPIPTHTSYRNVLLRTRLRVIRYECEWLWIKNVKNPIKHTETMCSKAVFDVCTTSLSSWVCVCVGEQ